MDKETITLARSDADGYDIALRRRFQDGQTAEELIINGRSAMDSSNTSSEIALADALGPNPGHVLLGGLGLGVTASRLLSNGADQIDIVELSNSLVEWAKSGLTSTLGHVASHPDVTIRCGDIADLLGGQPTIPGLFGPWDGICLDVDNGPDFLIHEYNAKLYTISGIRSMLEHLNPGGKLAIWSHAPSKEFWFDLTSIDKSATELLVGVKHSNRRMDYAIYTIHRPD